jgi:voltage-gated potassium channel
MWEQQESGRVVHRFEPLVLAATLTLIPVLIIETEAKSDFWQDFAFAANWVIWAVFVAELVFIFTVAPRKGAALRAHWLDELVVVVTAPLFGKFLASLRLVRLARLLRLLRLGAILSRTLQRERALSSEEIFRFVALLTLFIVVIAGAAEATVDRKEFPSFWRGIWWAVVTVTTVGYGDITPKTVQGRIVAVVVMLFGIGFLSVLTATIASRFVQTDTSSDEMVSALHRIEADLADLKRQVAGIRR